MDLVPHTDNAIPATNESFRNVRLVVFDILGTPIELTIE
jgi:hypothetical protein